MLACDERSPWRPRVILIGAWCCGTARANASSGLIERKAIPKQSCCPSLKPDRSKVHDDPLDPRKQPPGQEKGEVNYRDANDVMAAQRRSGPQEEMDESAST